MQGVIGAHRDAGADDLVDVFYSFLHSLAHVPVGSLVLTTVEQKVQRLCMTSVLQEVE